MIKHNFYISTIAILALLFTSGCKQDSDPSLMIATSANVQFAMEEIIEAFTEETGIPAVSMVSSSGKLSSQITHGAPFDVFVSADMQYPLNLYRNGYAVEKPRAYAYGSIVIFAVEGVEPSFESMTSPGTHHVAIPNPKTAPYGVAAMSALKNSGIPDSISEQVIVFGSSVGQVSSFITSGAAEIGIVGKSIMFSPIAKGFTNWSEIPADYYSHITQGVILLNGNVGNQKYARQFYDFMLSETSRSILDAHGYELPKKK